jgi:hypothetical protein
LGDIQIIDHHIHALRRLDADRLFTQLRKHKADEERTFEVLRKAGFKKSNYHG